MKPVITRDTERDITALLEQAGQQFGFDPVGFLGGALAESNVSERAVREQAWPDVSYGLWQPAVKWLGKQVPGLTRAPDGTVADTPNNRATARAFCFDAAQLTPYVASLYANLVAQYENPLEAWCRWNSPGIPGSRNSHQQSYVNGLQRAEAFRTLTDVPAPAAAAVPQPTIEVVGANPANVWQGQGLANKLAIVCHIMEGTLAGCIAWFNNPAAQASSNYGVGKDGRIVCFVNPQGPDAPFANGGLANPDASVQQLLVQAGNVNPNFWTVSIEHEGHRGEVLTDAQLEATAALSAWLCQTFNIPSDEDHLLGHYEFDDVTRAGCPGWNRAGWLRYEAAIAAVQRGRGLPTRGDVLPSGDPGSPP